MKKAVTHFNAVIFAVIFIIACVSSSFDKYKGEYLFGYFGPHSLSFTVIRYAVITVIIFALTYLNRNNTKLFTVILPTELVIVSICAYIDYFITLKFIYNYSYCLWLGASISVATGALFLASLLFIKNDFDRIFKTLLRAYALIYILIFYVSFIRKPDSFTMTVNMSLGNGTLKYFSYVIRYFDDPYLALICVGNILIFLPLPFIIKALSFRINDYIILIIGLILPFIVEAYQYIFRCGNVDIDDIVLNITGFLIGFLIMKTVYNKKIKAS